MFLDILEKLMESRGLNKNTLAKESGIPYTTIDGFWKKGCDNIKLSTLIKIANYFEVSLDYLLGYDNNKKTLVTHEGNELSEFEVMALDLFRKVPKDKQEELLQLIRVALRMQGLS